MSEEKKKSNFPFPGGRKFTGAVLLLVAAVAKCVLAGACDWVTIVVGASGVFAFIVGEFVRDSNAATAMSFRDALEEVRLAVSLGIKDRESLKSLIVLPLSLALCGLVACAPISGGKVSLNAINAAPELNLRPVLQLQAPETAESGICTEELEILAEKHKKCTKSLAGCDETYSIAVTGLLAESQWYRDLHPALQKLVRGSIYAGIGALIILVTANGG